MPAAPVERSAEAIFKSAVARRVLIWPKVPEAERERIFTGWREAVWPAYAIILARRYLPVILQRLLAALLRIDDGYSRIILKVAEDLAAGRQKYSFIVYHAPP